MKTMNVLKPRSTGERIGYWIMVAAAGLLLIILLATVLGPTLKALGVALVMSGFVAFLTALNSRVLADRANAALHTRIFPIITADERAVGRLVRVNAGLTFAFAFVFTLLSGIFGTIFSALILAGLVALAVYGLPRLRRPASSVITTTFRDRTPTDHVA